MRFSKMLFIVVFLIVVFRVSAQSQLSWSYLPDTLAFGDVAYNDQHLPGSKTLIIVIRHWDWNDTLLISSIVSSTSEFTVDSSCLTLEPLAGTKGKAIERILHITFTPSTVGTFIGVLTLTTNDPAKPTVHIGLSGSGVTAPSGISGVKTVGVGGDYTTLTEAFDSINAHYILDGLRLNLIDADYNEPNLSLHPQLNTVPPSPLTIGPSTGSLAVVNIHCDSTTSGAFNILNTSNIRVDSLKLVCDSTNVWETVVKIQGNCRDVHFDHSLIDGGHIYSGFHTSTSLGDTLFPYISNCTIEHVITGILLEGTSSISLTNSVIHHESEMGMYIEVYGGEVNIEGNTFDGSNVADFGLGGYGIVTHANISNNTFIGYRLSGIMLDGFEGIESVISKTIMQESRTTRDLSSLSVRERIHQKIAPLKERIHQRSVKQNSTKGVKQIASSGRKHDSRSPDAASGDFIFSGNTVIPDTTGAEMGIYIGGVNNTTGTFQISLNTIRNVMLGIFIEGVGDVQTVRIDSNNITGGRYLSPKTGTWIQAEIGVFLQGYFSEMSSSILNISHNTISDFQFAIYPYTETNGEIHIDDNILNNTMIGGDGLIARLVTVDRNHINGFKYSGMELPYLAVYDPNSYGGASISHNVISCDTNQYRGLLAMYIGLAEMYYLKVDSNTVTGSFTGDGIYAEGLFPPIWAKTSEQQARIASLKDESREQRMVRINSQQMQRERSKTINRLDRKKVNRQTESFRHNSISSLTAPLSDPCYFSLSGNYLNYRGGGWDSVWMFRYGTGLMTGWIGGPVDVHIRNNVIATDSLLHEGIMSDGVEELRHYDLIDNMIRNTYLGFYCGGGYMPNGTVLIEGNDIESSRDEGLYFDFLEAIQSLEVSKNRIRSLYNQNQKIGLSIAASCWDTPNSIVIIDSNIVENYNTGLYNYGEEIEATNINRNTIRHNQRGITWEGYGEHSQSGTIAGNVVTNNLVGVSLELDGFRLPVDIRYNSFTDNDSVGVMIRTDQGGVPPIFRYNNLSAGHYAFINNGKPQIDARFNRWDVATTAEMDAGPYPKNISSIFDVYDDTSRGFIEYADWLHDTTVVQYGSISGTKFNDVNGNSIFDMGEPGLAGWLIKLLPNDLYETTDENGNYRFSYIPPGSYVVSEIPKNYWEQTAPLAPGTYNITLTAGQSETSVNFGNRIIPSIRDLSVRVTGGIARPGFFKNYGIRYESKGTEAVPATVTFQHPEHTTFISAKPVNSSYDALSRTVSWDVGLVEPGTIRSINVWVQIAPPPDVNIGETLSASAAILPMLGDEDTTDNYASEWEVVRGSFDPNDKNVDPPEFHVAGYISSNTALTYLIRFQNTGTDTAFNIIVRDTLDPDLDIGTINFGASSHPYTYEINGDRLLKLTFADIHLPDSVVNESESHGFVSYTILPRQDAADNVIRNTANIYFDYNLPVRTNTVESRIKQGVSVMLADGWNMVSVPNIVMDYKKSVTFPTALSDAFSYTGSYNSCDTLRNGVGYWIKFRPEVFVIMGDQLDAATIAVREGWNMIGSLSMSIPTSAIVPIGTSIVSEFYSYDGEYLTTTSIEPGYGYWVKVSANGQLSMSSTYAGRQYATPSQTSTLHSITIRDNLGRKQRLYLSNESLSSLERYEMPPTAPGGFDARFTTGRMIESFASTNVNRGEPTSARIISIQSSAYPIIVEWNIRAATKEKVIYTLSNGDNILAEMKGIGSIRILDQKITKLVVSPKSNRPSWFSLSQNYPNPFNPITTIQYQLPEDSKVSIKIYNTLGQLVISLTDRVEEAGFKSVEWNASSVSSGVYFYRLEATSISAPSKTFTQVKKMLLVK